MSAEEAEGRKMTPVYTAPPRSASDGALLEAAAKIASSYDGVNFPPAHRHANIIAQAIRALAASEATKSDGGAKAGSSPILASKEDQRSDTHGMMPVGDNAANIGSTGVGPSDSSSTHSEVTVDELVRWCKRNQFFPSWDKARALLDQFEIRRK